MRSIRAQTTLVVGGALAALLLCGCLSLYLTLDKVLSAQFDEGLNTKAQALITASEVDDGEYEIDLDIQAFAGFGSKSPGDYFEVTDSRGKTLQRSPSLAAGQSLPALSSEHNGIGTMELPDGRTGRVIWRTFTPSDDDQNEYPNLRLVVASDLSVLHATLRAIAMVLWMFGVAGLVISLFIVYACLPLGLQPLKTLSAEVQEMRADRLNQRVDVSHLPEELRVFATKLNELLQRLESSFARERRFTSHAAHELRTPLAELKTMLELNTRWPDEFTQEQGTEMLQTAGELERLLDRLSLLAKAESVAAQAESTELRPILEANLQRLQPAAEARNLSFSMHAPEVTLRTDPLFLNAIVQNLLENAVSYAVSGSQIEIQATGERLVVSNEAHGLTPDDLPQMFERFWRKSSDRSDRNHSGLGLSIVRGCAEQLGGSCSATLDGGRLSIVVEWQAPNC